MTQQTASTHSAAEIQPLPFYVTFGWGLGSLGVLSLLFVTNALVLKYAVDVLGLSALVAGLVAAACRIFDALLDPFMGTISDNTRTRWGRRRPYILLGTILCGMASVLIFAAPESISEAMLPVYFGFALVFYAVAYTVFNVPYMAMPVEMTQDRHERTFMFSFRVHAGAIAGLIGGGLAPFLVDWFGGGRSGYASMGVVIGLFIFAACLACFLLTSKAPVNLQAQADKSPKLSQIKETWKNKPFIWLMVAKILVVGGAGIGGSSMAFFATIALGKSLGWLAYITAGQMIGIMLSQFLWLKIAKRFGKRACFIAAACLYVLATLTWLTATPESTEVSVAIRAFAMGICMGGIMLASQAMLPDTLDHEFELTGVRHEGVLTGIYTTVERGSSALGVALAGFILSAGGYVAGAAAADQPASAINAIYASMAIFPSIGMFASACAIWQYRLDG